MISISPNFCDTYKILTKRPLHVIIRTLSRTLCSKLHPKEQQSSPFQFLDSSASSSRILAPPALTFSIKATPPDVTCPLPRDFSILSPWNTSTGRRWVTFSPRIHQSHRALHSGWFFGPVTMPGHCFFVEKARHDNRGVREGVEGIVVRLRCLFLASPYTTCRYSPRSPRLFSIQTATHLLVASSSIAFYNAFNFLSFSNYTRVSFSSLALPILLFRAEIRRILHSFSFRISFPANFSPLYSPPRFVLRPLAPLTYIRRDTELKKILAFEGFLVQHGGSISVLVSNDFFMERGREMRLFCMFIDFWFENCTLLMFRIIGSWLKRYWQLVRIFLEFDIFEGPSIVVGNEQV